MHFSVPAQVEFNCFLTSHDILAIRVDGRVIEVRATTATGAGYMGKNRVIRGGSWNDNARNCRAAYRNSNHPGNGNHWLGVRVDRAASDPPRDLSAVVQADGFGEKQTDAGVLVARVDARVSARRRSTYRSREEVGRGR